MEIQEGMEGTNKDKITTLQTKFIYIDFMHLCSVVSAAKGKFIEPTLQGEWVLCKFLWKASK